MVKLVLIASFGALGAVTRYGVRRTAEYLSKETTFFRFFDSWFDGGSHLKSTFISSVATLFSNGFAALLLGIVFAISLHWMHETPFFLSDDLHKMWINAAAIGFCGALSTFSTFTEETFVFLEKGSLSLAVGNVAANLSVSLALFFFAYRFTFLFFRAS